MAPEHDDGRQSEMSIPGRFSRRRLLQTLTAAGLVGPVLAACGGGDKKSTDSGIQQPPAPSGAPQTGAQGGAGQPATQQQTIGKLVVRSEPYPKYEGKPVDSDLVKIIRAEDFSDNFNGNGGATVPTTTPEAAGIPDWATLFGPTDFCECEHCRSVLSPAAYLVDILHFLRDRTRIDKALPARSALDVLFARRADIGDIRLTCENTNTPVAYVDLLIEALNPAVGSTPGSSCRLAGT